MNIFIGADHAGYELKNFLAKALSEVGYRVVDCGAHTYQPSDDYPYYISKVAKAISEAEAIKVSNDEADIIFAESRDEMGANANSLKGGEKSGENNHHLNSSSNETRGIVIGGSGQGEAIVANKFTHVRAALCYGGERAEDIIDLSREHNDANVLALGARFLSHDLALELVLKWLSTPFSGDHRHVRRIHEIELLHDNHQLYE